jgi:hypothetical protein
MSGILGRIDAWVTALALAGTMVATWRIGLWAGRRAHARTGAAPSDKVEDASST